MKLTWNILNQYLDDGLIIANKHPEVDLWILNYTRTTQFEKKWDEVTLACRGLVVDADANIVARPLPKFFNDFEYPEGVIPWFAKHEVFVKMDGSLGIVFKYNGEVILASRGSFASEQSKMGKIIFDREPRAYNFILPGYTYAFEIIYPSNRIVVDYGKDEKLVLLACYQTDNNFEVPYDLLKGSFDVAIKTSDHISIVEKVQLNVPLAEARTTIQGADEGYIVRFKGGFRMKIKGEEYCRLHRILTEVSNKSIWKSLREDLPLDEILDRIPDEYDAWVEKTIADFKTKFAEIENTHRAVLVELEAKQLEPRWFAYELFEVCEKENLNSGIIFSMKNNTDRWKKIIWDMIYPKFEKAAKTVHELKSE